MDIPVTLQLKEMNILFVSLKYYTFFFILFYNFFELFLIYIFSFFIPPCFPQPPTDTCGSQQSMTYYSIFFITKLHFNF